MKKIMIAALGVSLLSGSVVFAQDKMSTDTMSTDTTGKKKSKKKKKKDTGDTMSTMAPKQ